MAQRRQIPANWSGAIEKFIDSADKDFANCRAIGHQWDHWREYWISPPTTGWRVSLRCERCGCIRNDIVDAFGFTVGRSYRYPTGYAYTGDEHIPKAAWKLRMAERYGNDERPETE